MPAERFCLDANILFYAIDPADRRRRELGGVVFRNPFHGKDPFRPQAKL